MKERFFMFKGLITVRKILCFQQNSLWRKWMPKLPVLAQFVITVAFCNKTVAFCNEKAVVFCSNICRIFVINCHNESNMKP